MSMAVQVAGGFVHLFTIIAHTSAMSTIVVMEIYKAGQTAALMQCRQNGLMSAFDRTDLQNGGEKQ